MDFEFALKNYGTDKPDTRYEFLIKDYSNQFKTLFGKEYVKAIIFDRDVNKNIKLIEEIFYKNGGEFFEVLDLSCATCHVGTNLAKTKEATSFKQSYALIAAGNDEESTLKALGAIRTLLNELYQLANPEQLNFLWIVNW
ncbi:aspartyl-tRNA synthetase, partial [Metamycoplasma alkalescens]